jgi:hypothetical protein
MLLLSGCGETKSIEMIPALPLAETLVAENFGRPTNQDRQAVRLDPANGCFRNSQSCVLNCVCGAQTTQ